jgi:hypothetical protein
MRGGVVRGRALGRWPRRLALSSSKLTVADCSLLLNIALLISEGS